MFARLCPPFTLLVALTGCGPGLGDSSGETDPGEASSDTDIGMDASSETDEPSTETDDPGDDTGPLICPCEEVEPEVISCAGGPTAFESQRLETATIATLASDFTGRAVVLDGAVHAVFGSTESTVQRWTPGADAFETVVSLDEPAEIEGLAVDDGALWLLTRAQSGDGALSSWNDGRGLNELVALPEMPAELAAWWRLDARLRVGNGVATFAAADVTESDQALFTYPVVTIDLESGALEQSGEAVTGYAPAATGVVALQAEIGDRQFCADFACLHDDVATAWAFVNTSGGISAQSLCVGAGNEAGEVINAWTTSAGEYIYVTEGVVQRVLPDGSAESLWSGEAEIIEAVLEDEVLLISTHNEGENQLFEVPLNSSIPQLLYSVTSDHPAKTIRIAGTIDETLYIVAPAGDDKDLLALTR